MTILKHKDYLGSVNFCDGVLVIKILHIDDSVSTECDSAAATQAVFEEMVDDYLETCSVVGKQPNKPFKGSFNVRVGADLHKKAAMASVSRGETLNAWVIGAIEDKIDRQMPSLFNNIDFVTEVFQKKYEESAFHYDIVGIADLFTSLSAPRLAEAEKFATLFSPVTSVEGGYYEH